MPEEFYLKHQKIASCCSNATIYQGFASKLILQMWPVWTLMSEDMSRGVTVSLSHGNHWLRWPMGQEEPNGRILGSREILTFRWGSCHLE